MDNALIFKQLFIVSQNTGQTAYVVGGFVRDQLLEKNGGQIAIPAKKDIDVVVTGSGIDFAKHFDEQMEQVGSLILFPDFDTARYVMADIELEFAGARSEVYTAASRKPVVTATTIETDLGRRDFTVNAMARVIEKNGLGVLLDPWHGEEDLHHQLLRTPLDPDVTFSDDPLRMLRAARFASQLSFSIDPVTVAAMERHRERLRIVSAERIKEELFKLLATRQPSIGLWILYGTKLLDQFLPEISALSGVEEVFGYTHKDNLSHTFAVVDNIAEYSDKPLLRYTGLLHDIAKPATKKFDSGRGWTFDMHEHVGRKMAAQISRRLRLSTSENAYVTKLVRWHLQPIALMDEGITDSAVRRLIVNLGDDLQDLLVLCRGDITTGNQKKKVHRLKNYDHLEERIAFVIEKDHMRAFQSPVRGEEIMSLLGLKPGPTVGRIKEAIEEAILAGTIPNEYEAAKAYLLQIQDHYITDIQPWEKII